MQKTIEYITFYYLMSKIDKEQDRRQIKTFRNSYYIKQNAYSFNLPTILLFINLSHQVIIIRAGCTGLDFLSFADNYVCSCLGMSATFAHHPLFHRGRQLRRTNHAQYVSSLTYILEMRYSSASQFD